jgi:hypothetical protein
MVENLTVEDILLLALPFSHISTIPSVLHKNFKFKYQPLHVILAINTIIKYNTFLSPSLLFNPASECVVLF